MIEKIETQELENIKAHAEKIINAIATMNYAQIPILVDDMGSWDIAFLEQVIENFKQDNEFPHIDTYDVECTYNPQYADGSKYSQEDVFEYMDNHGYGYEYHLTTNGMPNDLTLQLVFQVVDNTKMKVIFESGITVL